MEQRFQIQDGRPQMPAWVDPYPANAVQQLVLAMPAMGVHALFDNAYDNDFRQRFLRRFPTAQLRSLYEGLYEGPGLKEIAPTLTQVPDAPAERQAFIAFLLQETSGKPMLSFLHSGASGSDPLVHLKHQLEAVDHTGHEFLIRLADTSALDALLEVFDDAQRQRFLGNLRWWYFRRDGSLQCASNASKSEGDADVGPYQCTATQMDKLEALARPGAILNVVRNSPHMFGVLQGLPSQAYACILRALESVEPSGKIHDALTIRAVAAALNEAGLVQPHTG
ncbi:hypothetical protein CJO80_03050 [Ralstonia solanacearum]|nr:hypothetical protein CJO80_03050 [Ralstonia solanacearum]